MIVNEDRLILAGLPAHIQMTVVVEMDISGRIKTYFSLQV